ncbi:MAG: ABC transporter substrate-binding protein [Clostridiaceae bacterium]|nr:ABC transporter substrate-binding protein [Clostridiaceae bacterium]
MRKIFKCVALTIVLNFLLVFLFAGCGQVPPDMVEEVESTEHASVGDANESRPDEEVRLKMYLVGDKYSDFDLVYEQLNTMLMEDINATVDVSFMGWGDYTQRYPLAFASGDNFDLIFTANWCYYSNQAVKGGFVEITREMLAQYAPMTADTMYEDAWEQAKIDGRVFMLPMNYKELNSYVYMVRGDLMDKYGIRQISDLAEFGEYLDAVAKNEPGIIPLDTGTDLEFDTLLRFGVLAPLNLEILEPQQLNHFFNLSSRDSGQIINIIETPEFLEYAKEMKGWREKGYWSKSALVNKVTAKESFTMGKSASAIMNLSTANGIYMSVSVLHPEWDVRVYDGMKGSGVAIKPYIQNGMGINANSRNPERALMFLDLVRNDERYAQLVMYGIEGVHYEKTAQGKVRPLADTVKYPIDSNCNWCWRDDRFILEVEGGIPNYNDIRSAWERTAYSHPVQSFIFNDTAVKNEVSNVTNLWKTDYKVIVLGFTEDTEREVNELIKKYQNAGDDRIIQEQQMQIDNYMKSLR